MLFYAAVLLGLVGALRLSLRLVAVLGGLAVFGVVMHAIAKGVDATWVSGVVGEDTTRLAAWASDWVVVPDRLESWIPPVTYIGLITLALVLTLLSGWVRLAVLVPTLYLAAFVWENVMLVHPESTRFILLGAMLISLMIVRPAGLLGERRVEIV
jgi:hypothetical protein